MFVSSDTVLLGSDIEQDVTALLLQAADRSLHSAMVC